MNLSDLAPLQLLELHSNISTELKDRGVTRSYNNPAGDYAEYLFCRAFGWNQAPNSKRSYDAADQATGDRFQIKCRRLTASNTSRQLSQLRNLEDGGFDFLAGVLFASRYRVLRAALVPQPIVLERSTYVAHTNSWKFILRDSVWDEEGVLDVTEQLLKEQQ